MNTTIQALQALYVKLGGSLTDTYSTIANGVPVSDYTTIPDMIEACTQKAGSGGGASLPAVTAEDNGSVLTVVEGNWDKGEAPAGAVEILEFTFSSSGETQTLTSEKTASEILTAVNAGKFLVARGDLGDGMWQQLSVGNIQLMPNTDNYQLIVYTSTEAGQAPVCLMGTAADGNSPFVITMG